WLGRERNDFESRLQRAHSLTGTSRWSHHRPRVWADECWVFARVRHDADRARVTALVEKVTGLFGRIPRHSGGVLRLRAPRRPSRIRPEWQPNGSHFCGDPGVIPGYSRSAREGVPDGLD